MMYIHGMGLARVRASDDALLQVQRRRPPNVTGDDSESRRSVRHPTGDTVTRRGRTICEWLPHRGPFQRQTFNQ